MSSGVYGFVNLATNMYYIGSAVNFKRRWSNHLIELRLNRHCNIYLQAAYNKYGESSFKFYVLEIVEDKTKLIEREQHWLDHFKSYDREIGYNLCAVAGNVLGRKASKETKALLSAIRKGKPRSEETKAKIAASWKHRKVSEEAKRNMSLAHIGKQHSEDFKVKMSQRLKGNTFNLGRKQTIEHKAKISAAKKIAAHNRKKPIDLPLIVGMPEVMHSP